MSIGRFRISLLIFMLIALLSASLLSPFVLAIHSCSDCAPDYVICKIIHKLQDISRQLARLPLGFCTWLVALLLIILQAPTEHALIRQHASSLVGWCVKLSC